MEFKAYRTNVFCLSPTKDEHKILMELADACSAFYNVLNYKRRQSFFQGNVDFSSEVEYKAFSPTLGAYIATGIRNKNNQAWNSFFELLEKAKNGELPDNIKKVRPPGYWKDRVTGERYKIIVIRGDGYSLNSKTMSIPLGKVLKKKYGIERLEVRWKGKPRWKGKQGYAEIIYDRVKKKWYVHQSVLVSFKGFKDFKAENGGKIAVVDLNVVVPSCSLVEGEKQPTGYSGRDLLSDWYYWSRRTEDYMSKIAKSTNCHYSTRELKRLHGIKQTRLKHALNAMVKADMLRFKEKGVGLVIVDYPSEGVRSENKGRKVNQMLNNIWCYSYIFKRYVCLGQELGIRVVKASDLDNNPAENSSKRCPICFSMNTVVRGRMLKCRDCGAEVHKDAAADVNMLENLNGNKNKNKKNKTIGAVSGGRINGVVAHPMLHRWNMHRWSRTREPPEAGESHAFPRRGGRQLSNRLL